MSSKVARIVDTVLLGTILIAVFVFAWMILAPMPRVEPYRDPSNICLWRIGSALDTPNPTEDAGHARCLTQQASWTPTPPPWWQFWSH